jgi:Zn ribbon nucleic-acid-binding protein
MEDSNMGQAKTYLFSAGSHNEMVAQCPACNFASGVDWVEPDKATVSENNCEKCGAAFTYAHPHPTNNLDGE